MKTQYCFRPAVGGANQTARYGGSAKRQISQKTARKPTKRRKELKYFLKHISEFSFKYRCGKVCGLRSFVKISPSYAGSGRITSRIVAAPVEEIAKRSIPIPIPPDGGKPFSNAVTKSSSSIWSFIVASFAVSTLSIKTGTLF